MARHASSRRRQGLWQRFVVRPWRTHVLEGVEEAERASQEAIAERGGALDWRVIGVCLVVALNLTLLQYYGLSNTAAAWVPGALRGLGLDGIATAFEEVVLFSENARLWSLVYWVGACVLFYFAIPVLVVRFVFQQRLSDYGLSLKGSRKHLKLYLLMYAIVLPLVVLVSFDEQFLRQYPFYKDRGGVRIPPYFFVWEMAYAAQFFALEFFFRGFMVHGLKHRFGAYAIFAMMVPYCMIHYGKPFPETLGAIVAGLVLGFFSLRTGSIWLGFLIHVSVALTMDLAALWQLGLL